MLVYETRNKLASETTETHSIHQRDQKGSFGSSTCCVTPSIQHFGAIMRHSTWNTRRKRKTMRGKLFSKLSILLLFSTNETSCCWRCRAWFSTSSKLYIVPPQETASTTPIDEDVVVLDFVIDSYATNGDRHRYTQSSLWSTAQENFLLLLVELPLNGVILTVTFPPIYHKFNYFVFLSSQTGTHNQHLSIEYHIVYIRIYYYIFIRYCSVVQVNASNWYYHNIKNIV